MDGLRTPGKANRVVKASTPSPRKKKEWKQGVSKASAAYTHRVNQILAGLEELLTEPNEGSVTKEATAFALQEKLRTICQSQEYDIVGAVENESTPNDIADAQDDFGQVSLRGAHDMVKIEKYTKTASDSAQATSTADSDVQPDTALSTLDHYHAALGLPSTVDPAVEFAAFDPWTEVLNEMGIVQGTAQNQLPVYVGGRGLSAPPAALPVNMDLTANFDQAQIQKIQGELWTMFTDLSWEARKDRRSCTMKLHPWAVITWVNFFTGSLLGAPGLKAINQVIRHASERNEFGQSSRDVETAQALAQDESKTPNEREFYAAVAATLRGEVKATNTYVKLRKRLDAVAVCVRFEAMIADFEAKTTKTIKQDTPLGKRRSSPRKKTGSPGKESFSTPGVSARDLVGQACANDMKWKSTDFWNFLTRFEGLYTLAAEFSDGILVLVTPTLQNMIKNNAQSGIPSLVAVVKRHFPEFQQLCEEIHALVGQKLVHPDPDIKAEVLGKTIAVDIGRTDMTARLRATFE